LGYQGGQKLKLCHGYRYRTNFGSFAANPDAEWNYWATDSSSHWKLIFSQIPVPIFLKGPP
jgi:hypothetical protein